MCEVQTEQRRERRNTHSTMSPLCWFSSSMFSSTLSSLPWSNTHTPRWFKCKRWGTESTVFCESSVQKCIQKPFKVWLQRSAESSSWPPQFILGVLSLLSCRSQDQTGSQISPVAVSSPQQDLRKHNYRQRTNWCVTFTWVPAGFGQNSSTQSQRLDNRKWSHPSFHHTGFRVDVC